MWEQGVRLEDRVNIALIGRDIIDSYAIQQNITRVASSKPAIILRMVDFPEPEAPRSV